MFKFVLGAFILLHGLVHLWYFTLSQGLVEYQPEMGWTGRSWLFTRLLGDGTTGALASLLYILAAPWFVLGGTGWFFDTGWWRPVLESAALFSSAVILLFWEGGLQMGVQKGLLGVFIDLGLLLALFVFK
jgi:hypothetical protein